MLIFVDIASDSIPSAVLYALVLALAAGFSQYCANGLLLPRWPCYITLAVRVASRLRMARPCEERRHSD